jgi:Domain of unknown function (DUF4349)
MTDVLTAIDDALDTGVAADEDPLTRELQELALTLRADAPEPTAEFRERMERRVEAGFARPRRLKPRWWHRLSEPAAAIGMTAAAVLVIAVAASGLSGPNGDESGGGRGASGDSGGGGRGAIAGSGPGGGGTGADVDGRPGVGAAEPAEVVPRTSAGSTRSADDALAGGVGVPPPSGGFAPGRSDRRIERSVALELETPVEQMARVAEQVTAVTNRHGGFVLSSSVSTGADGAGGDFDLRVPAARLRPALRDLAALADVRTQSQTGRDVTREHVTAKDRLRAARAERRSLLRRLELAATDEEAEAIRRRLDLVAGEINGLRGQLRNLRLRTDYSVVTVTLLAADDEGGAGGGSFDDALGDAGDLLVTVAGWIVRALAVALPLGLVALAGWAAARVLRRRRRESALA